MGERRIDQLAAQNRPTPRPLTEPIEILPPHPSGRSGNHRPQPKRRSLASRWSRRLRRGLASKRGRWVLIGLACLMVLLVGLLSQGYFHSPAPAVHLPDAAAASGGVGEPTPTPTASGGKHGGKKGHGKVVDNPIQRLRDVLPDNPLNNLNLHDLHQVHISVSTPGSISVIGYLVPTGLGSTYGVVHPKHGPWALNEQALGGGYLAAMFIQTDKAGSPMTCTITVDGKVTNTQTTSGSYGRAVCLG